jgi:hypothetical protein
MIRSPCAAAKKRERGPSVSERRAAEEAAVIAAAEKPRRVKPAVHGVPGTVAVQAAAVDGTPMGCRTLGRGKASMNSPLKLGGSVQAMEDRKASLMAAAEFRPSAKMTAVAPAGTGKLDEKKHILGVDMS